jgi:hypothetical protein
MSVIRPQLVAHSWQLHSTEFPVEVRRDGGPVTARGMTGSQIHVEPGAYAVIARMPAGTTMTGEVTVGEHDNLIVQLRPEPEDESPHESEEVPRFIWGQTGVDIPAGYDAPEFELRCKLRLWAGNALAGPVQVESSDGLRQQEDPFPDGVLGFFPSTEGLLFAQLVQRGRAPVITALAVPPLGTSPAPQVIVTLDRDNHFDLQVRLSSVAADALLSFTEHGRSADAAAMTETNEIAEALLFEKVKDPLAAAAGGYTLLRSGALERLHDWTENLCNWFPWLPDGLVIRAEHLVRTGHTVEASDLLLELPQRGLPLFTEGFSLALDRLRRSDALEARDLVGRLSRYLPFMDFARTFFTFSGEEPGTPELHALDARAFDDIEGLPITPRGTCVSV